MAPANGHIANQTLVGKTSDDIPNDSEAVLPSGDLSVTTANDHELADQEMVLEDGDLEGWDDVESNASEDGASCDDYSEDDFGQIYD